MTVEEDYPGAEDSHHDGDVFAVDRDGEFEDTKIGRSAEYEFLHAVLATAECLVVVLDPQGHIVLFSPACERATGYLQRELIGESVWERLIPKDDIAGTRRVFTQLIQGSFPIHYENNWRTAEGNEISVTWSNTVLHDDEGEIEFIIATGLDVTGHRAMAEQLKDRDQRLRAIFEQSPESIVTINENGIIESLNPAVERMFGYSQKELWGSNISILMPAPHKDNHDEYLRHYVETGIPHIIGTGRKLYGRKKSGELFPLHLSVTEIHDGHRLFLGIMVDLTEREHFEQEVLRGIEEERQRIAQELHDGSCSALSGIAMLVRRLKNHLEADGSSRVEEADMIEKLIGKTVSELRRTTHFYAPASTDHFDLDEALANLRIMAESEGTNLRIENALTHSPFDPLRLLHLFRIAQEAVHNSLKHAHAQNIEIGLFVENDALVLRVQDDGNGFDSGATGWEAGLGLRSMRYRADLMGGEFHIDSSPGCGTTIRIRLWNI